MGKSRETVFGSSRAPSREQRAGPAIRFKANGFLAVLNHHSHTQEEGLAAILLDAKREDKSAKLPLKLVWLIHGCEKSQNK